MLKFFMEIIDGDFIITGVIAHSSNLAAVMLLSFERLKESNQRKIAGCCKTA